ncbi:iron chelate uptake ABC transporter family permease subunit [Enterococcus mundtii]|uniref:Iron ABC transporter permease n=2 Tax=Enterococcus mundtii TaxID=53346 RepID=A0A2S7RW75_ENTMU|nr:iron chelate uptake ABC transporter family permease subunit [Enterococcus mundtii]MZZ62318.1 iron chelate uptake ABC transporter family permease subunit [Enterococcus mundtii]MZZ68493.1 iron chelate uptake ABC transporter family permease subunit [Enterococcus mundtii]MZZ97260.1 iron chelate uptake ABC transporter family permease subunit [Enterococcus mundtii]NAA00584.1 iron chelate uptake ABC transporter family permease subunit [Enterococcus mundtii]
MNTNRWKMNKQSRLLLAVVLSIIVVFFGIKIGSVSIPFDTLIQALFSRGDKQLDATIVTILWQVRLPRVVLAFLVGAALAVSGTVMQSLLGNPLASAYTLGVSSGASLGAALIIVSGITLPLFPNFTLPLTGFIFGLATVFIVLAMSQRLDQQLSNQTVILVGMVMTLFVGAMLTIVTALFKDHLQQLVFWQMGSFSGSTWAKIQIFLPILLFGTIALWFSARSLDVLSLGEEEALISGVDVRTIKLWVMVLAALLAGSAVSFVGVIGFVDLIAPHVIRRYFGASHRWVIPGAALLGGSMMVVGDTISRTLLSPQEIPIGAVTALIGAPFFAYVYFKRK